MGIAAPLLWVSRKPDTDQKAAMLPVAQPKPARYSSAQRQVLDPIRECTTGWGSRVYATMNRHLPTMRGNMSLMASDIAQRLSALWRWCFLIQPLLRRRLAEEVVNVGLVAAFGRKEDHSVID
jgi:hypothetical protein